MGTVRGKTVMGVEGGKAGSAAPRSFQPSLPLAPHPTLVSGSPGFSGPLSAGHPT